MSGQSPGGVGYERRLTLVVTNVVKLAGAGIAVDNALTTKDALTYGVAALMIAGAQVFEEIVLGFLTRFFALPSDVASKTSHAERRERGRMDEE